MATNRNQRGRSARQRNRKCCSDTRHSSSDDHGFQLFVRELADRVQYLLAERQRTVLNEYADTLRRMAYRFDTETANCFFFERLREARTYGIEEQLRELVSEARKRFALASSAIDFTSLLP